MDSSRQDGPSAATGGILAREGGPTIAYDRIFGKIPGVVFLHGFKSDRKGTKALALEAFCRERGQAFLRFDAFGHGESSGDFACGTIGRWAEDAIAVIDALTEGPQILVGSSMGGWLMLLAALARPRRIAGLLGLAAAPDFTEELIYGSLSETDRRRLLTEGRLMVEDHYGSPPFPVTRALIEDGRNHLLLGAPINLHCPVRLIHGQADTDVPWRTALQLADHLTTRDVEVTLVKSAGHRLSEPADLALIERTLDTLIAQVG